MQRLALVALLAVMLSQRIALAAPPVAHSDGRQHALDLFEQSAQAYREGRFQDAVNKLLEARGLKKEPVLLYNLARAYEALGQWDQAANAYEQYVTEEPTTADRKAIEGRIITLRQQVAELAQARSAEANRAALQPTSVPSSQEARPRPRPSLAPWLVAGTGAVVVGTGAVFGLLAKGEHDDAISEPVQQKAATMQDSAETLARVSTAIFVVGAVVVVAGVTWALLRPGASSTTVGGAGSRARGPSGFVGWTFP